MAAIMRYSPRHHREAGGGIAVASHFCKSPRQNLVARRMTIALRWQQHPAAVVNCASSDIPILYFSPPAIWNNVNAPSSPLPLWHTLSHSHILSAHNGDVASTMK